MAFPSPDEASSPHPVDKGAAFLPWDAIGVGGVADGAVANRTTNCCVKACNASRVTSGEGGVFGLHGLPAECADKIDLYSCGWV